jgi:UDP-N-acetylglucosamine 2-epimerase (non-hydrolysing)
MSGLSRDRVLQAVDLATASASLVTVPDYGDTNVARKVVRIIASYVDYVRRTTWFEDLG